MGTSIIIARVLGPEGRGVYSLAILLPTFLIIFTQFGIGPASVYYIGKRRYPPKGVFGFNIIFSFLISIFAILVGLIAICFFGDKIFPGIQTKYLLLALSLIPFHIFFNFIIEILLGLQEIKKYNFVQLIRSFIFLFLIIIFLLVLHFKIESTIVALTISFFIGCVILFFQTKKETDGLVCSLDKNLLKDFFSYGSKAYFGNISTFLYLRIDMWMINIFLNPLAVGFYSIAVGLSEKIWLISQSAGTILFPKISSETNKKALKEFTPLVCRNILSITFLMALVIFLLSRWIIILFYSEIYLEAVIPLQILLIGAVALSGSRIITNDLSGRGKPLINSYLAVASMILNVFLNILLIPQFGIVGAAWATDISYIFMFVLKIIIYSRISNNKIKDIIFFKKADIALYKNFIFSICFNKRNMRCASK